MNELVFEYATTENTERASEILADLLLIFIAMYDDAYAEFVASNDIEYDITEYSEIRQDYYDHVLDRLQSIRPRTLEESQKLNGSEDYIRKLYHFVDVIYTRIFETQRSNAKQLGQLQAVLFYAQNNPNVMINKTWVAQPDCCPICAELAGTTIPITEYFLVNGQVVELDDDKNFVYSYDNTPVCVAHPNDRCYIEFSIEL